MHPYETLADGPSPDEFLEAGEGSGEWLGIQDLDTFFRQIYHYHSDKGLVHITVRWAAELFTFGFTISFSGFLLLWVNWAGVLSCGSGGSRCDLARDGVYDNPLRPFTLYTAVVVLYLLIFSVYWLICFLRFFPQLRENWEIRRFCSSSLGIGEAELQRASWAEVVGRLVEVQSRQRLCIVRQLSAHDIVSRIMRRENYLIGLLSQGVIALPVPHWLPGAGPFAGHLDARTGCRKHPVLTKTLEWSLNWCILHHMYDTNFLIRRDFTRRPDLLRRRLKSLGCFMLLVSPFYFLFMLMYFLMKNGEQFYHRPSTAGFRHWSNLARWTFREFNELDHCLKHRLDASYKHAVDYLKQFPASPTLLVVAKVVSYVAGSFAIVLLGTVLLHETILQASVLGHELGWYVAVFGTVSVVSRSLITEDFQDSSPEAAMRNVVEHTHYMPSHWREQESSERVRSEFHKLFQYRAVEFLEEMASIFTTPFILYFLLPQCVDDVLRFVQDFTIHIDGVGHVCSLSVFDAATAAAASASPSAAHDKMERSFVSFRRNYPGWLPEDRDSKPVQLEVQDSDGESACSSSGSRRHYRGDITPREGGQGGGGASERNELEEAFAAGVNSSQEARLREAREAMDRSRWWARMGPDASLSLAPESKFEPPVFGGTESSDDGDSRFFAGGRSELDKSRKAQAGKGELDQALLLHRYS